VEVDHGVGVLHGRPGVRADVGEELLLPPDVVGAVPAVVFAAVVGKGAGAARNGFERHCEPLPRARVRHHEFAGPVVVLDERVPVEMYQPDDGVQR